jgi:hypothetical protein
MIRVLGESIKNIESKTGKRKRQERFEIAVDHGGV